MRPTIVGEINNTPNSPSRRRVQRGPASPHAEQPLQRRRVRRHVGRRDDDGRVPGAAALVQRERHVSSKTFKVALLDADAGRAKDGTYLREGSEYYAKNLIPKGPQGQYAMFAMMNANGASYPAYHFGTQYYWNNATTAASGRGTRSSRTPRRRRTRSIRTRRRHIAANSAAITAFDADSRTR